MVGLESLGSAIGRGTFPGSDRARRLAEQDPGPGIAGLGVKGGFLSGVLARGLELRRDDGTVATAVVLVHRMSELLVTTSSVRGSLGCRSLVVIELGFGCRGSGLAFTA